MYTQQLLPLFSTIYPPISILGLHPGEMGNGGCWVQPQPVLALLLPSRRLYRRIQGIQDLENVTSINVVCRNQVKSF